MEELALHNTLIAGQARTEEKVDGINERLDRLNGSVGKLFDRVEISEKNLLAHEINCPVRTQVAEIKEKLATKDGSVKASAKWWGAIKAAVLLVAGALLYIVIIHLEALLQFYGKKP